MLDPGVVGRLEERKFICFLRKEQEPKKAYVGFVRDVPDPGVRVEGSRGWMVEFRLESRPRKSHAPWTEQTNSLNRYLESAPFQ